MFYHQKKFFIEVVNDVDAILEILVTMTKNIVQIASKLKIIAIWEPFPGKKEK